MKYCYKCGTQLERRYLKNEGMIPYCTSCHEYVFPIFSTACSMIVLNASQDKILLIKQYQRDAYVLVAGYINKGESAEQCAIREIKEEVGLNVNQLRFNRTEYFSKSNTLMINFICIVDDENFTFNEEVDEAKWFNIEEAYKNITPCSLAKKFLRNYFEHL